MAQPATPAAVPAAPKPRRWRRWFARIGIGLVVLILLVTTAGTIFLRRSLPQTSGTLQVAGLQQPVTVTRDTWGVPHIQAQNLHDVFLAQGYVTAQDRLWQMDLSRRAASGRLSEIIGAAALDTDRFFRTLGLRRAAEISIPALTDQSRQIVQWYADGVNTFMQQATATGKLSPEFTLLGYKPEPWTPVDSFAIGKYMAYDLGGNWPDEVFRYQALQKLGDKALDLFPSYPKDGALIMRSAMDSTADVSQLAALNVAPNPANGSNNWVVAGSKTQSGKPLLANDPHLGLGAPSVWYQSHLQAPGLNVIGTTFPGAPGIIVGHNEQIAWGVTNLGPDVQDLYIEQPNPANPKEFRYNGAYEPAKVLSETIKVKGQPDVPLEVLVTRHGPIMTNVLGTKESRPKDQLALRWTALDPSTLLDAIYGFDTATNWTEFKQALNKFDVPAQNFVFASVDGTIAYRGNGKIPIRKKGDGTIPVPGWTDEYEWTGYIPWDELPTTVNPPDGFIATANNKVVDDSYPYFMTSTWTPPYRETRIQEVLKAGKSMTVQDMERLQSDILDGRARLLLPTLLPALTQALTGMDLSAQENAALGLLRKWTYLDDARAAGPLIWNLWLQRLEFDLYTPALGEELWKQFTGKDLITDPLLQAAAAGRATRWVPEPGKTFGPLLVQSFQEAVARGADLQGGSPEKWQWGEYHQVPFAHPLGRQKPLNLLFDVSPVPIGGGSVTVGQMGFNNATGLVNHGAAWRQVVDLSNVVGNSFDVVTPGQSGHPLSGHYADQSKLWTKGEYHPQAMAAAAWGKDAAVLHLTP